MFTGLVEEVGQVVALQGEQLTVRGTRILEDMALGDSISVDGVCLTVVAFTGQQFTAQVSTETYSRAVLGHYIPGSLINLERSLRVGAKVGGHFVTGHIDGTGSLVSRMTQGAFWELTFSAPDIVQPYLAPKGSIAVNGVSLTIARLEGANFTVAVIPYTLKETNLYTLKNHQQVNLEGDILAKYVARMIQPKTDTTNLNWAFLAEHGYG